MDGLLRWPTNSLSKVIKHVLISADLQSKGYVFYWLFEVKDT